jgi:hypothetical protein
VRDLLARVGLLNRLTVIEARPVPSEHAGRTPNGDAARAQRKLSARPPSRTHAPSRR